MKGYNKIAIRQNSSDEYYAVIKSGNGKIIWETQLAGVTNKRTIINAIKALAKPYKIVMEENKSNIVA